MLFQIQSKRPLNVLSRLIGCSMIAACCNASLGAASLSDWETSKFLIPYCILAENGPVNANVNDEGGKSHLSIKDVALLDSSCENLTLSISSIGQTARNEQVANAGRRLSSDRASHYNNRLRIEILSIANKIDTDISADGKQTLLNTLDVLAKGTESRRLGTESNN